MPLPDPSSLTARRIARTEAYASKIQKMFSETVNELLSLPLTLPEGGSGEMYSFEAESEKIQSKVEQLMRRLHAASLLAIQQGIKLEWEEANKAADAIVKSHFSREARASKYMRGWNARNTEAMMQFIARSDSGMNLSKRIWQSCERLRDEMEVALTVSIGEGEDAGTISRRVRQYLKDPDLMFRRFRYKDEEGRWQKKWKKRIKDPDNPGRYKFIDCDRDTYKVGRGVYKSAAKNAMRVARTETNIAYRRADHARWQGLDFVLGQRVILSHSHPEEDICDDLSAPNLPEYEADDRRGLYPKDFVFDGWHPQCFCFVVPVMVAPEEMAKMNEAFVRGEDYTPKGEQVTEYPEEFKDWVRDNASKIKEAQQRGTEPYFVRNNAEVVENIINHKTVEKGVIIEDTKGASLKGSSKAETRRVLKDVIDVDYVGRTRDYAQDPAFRQYCNKLGINPDKVKPMSFLEADSGNSNKYRGNTNYDNNCVGCTLANELRRRGLNVTAGMEDSTFAVDFLDCWRTKTGEKPNYLIEPDKLIPKSEKETFKQLDKLMNVPNGRYVIGWSGPGKVRGHVLCAERINGELVFYDPQLGKNDCFWTLGEMMQKMDISKGFEILRIDNLSLNLNAVNKIVMSY